MIIYHGTPITPVADLLALAGHNFCVSHAARSQIRRCLAAATGSLLLDSGAFSVWRRGLVIDFEKVADWYCECYQERVDLFGAEAAPRLGCLLPDVIGGSAHDNHALIRDYARLPGAMPVWHMHESLRRLERLIADFDCVAWGSSGEFSAPRTPAWMARAAQGWEVIGRGVPPVKIHMLRGLSLAGGPFPFASADSTDLARNHTNRRKGLPITVKADTWARRAAATATQWWGLSRQTTIFDYAPQPSPATLIRGDAERVVRTPECAHAPANAASPIRTPGWIRRRRAKIAKLRRLAESPNPHEAARAQEAVARLSEGMESDSQ